MPHYKAPDNSVHYLDSEEFVHLLPEGSIAITDEEAEALRPQPDPKEAIKVQIAELEAKVTPRRIREALLDGHMQFILDIDEQIGLLRGQL